MNWKKVKLGDTASFINGYAFKPSDWNGAGLAIIRIQDLTGNAYETNYFDGVLPEKYKVVNGDILISWSASLGVYEWNRGNAWLNQHIFKVVFDKLEWEKSFFKHLVSYKITEMEKQVHGATMKHITKGKFDNIIVPHPPLPIQQKIAAILDKADALRKKDRQLLARYDELLQSIFYDMFGDPVKNEKGFSKVKLHTVCSEIVDCPHSTPIKSETKTNYACIRTTELKDGDISWESMQFVSEVEYKKRISRLTPLEGDIVYGREGSFGEAIIIPTKPSFCLGQRTMLFRPEYKKCNSIFLWSIIRSDFVYMQALRKNSGSTVGHVNVKDIKEFIIILPEMTLQNQFAAIAQNIQQQKQQVKQQMEQSEALFQSLLQRAFRGELVA